MSNASKVKRWFIHYQTEPIIISADSIRKDYESLDVVRDPRNKYIEVMPVEDHDRIVAERDELWKRATKFVMPGEMDTGESIEHYIKTLEQTIARQARVIEKLKLAVTDIANKNTCWRLYEIDKYKSYEDGWEGVAEFAGIVLNELEAIEQGEGM